MDYESLQKKHNLPAKQELELAFDIDLKEKEYPTREILKKMQEKLEHWCETIEGLLHSDSSIESLSEFEFLKESEKNEMFSIFKEFMSFRRGIQEHMIDLNESEDGKLIIEIFNNWNRRKKTLKTVLHTLKTKWQEKFDPKIESVRYFG